MELCPRLRTSQEDERSGNGKEGFQSAGKMPLGVKGME